MERLGLGRKALPAQRERIARAAEVADPVTRGDRQQRHQMVLADPAPPELRQVEPAAPRELGDGLRAVQVRAAERMLAQFVAVVVGGREEPAKAVAAHGRTEAPHSRLCGDQPCGGREVAEPAVWPDAVRPEQSQ